MVATQDDLRRQQGVRARRKSPRAIARYWWIGLLALMFAIFVWGGYAMGWRWTGLSGDVTLWDWLQVLALPVAIGVAPVLLRHRRRLNRRHRVILAAALTLFAGLVLAGYQLPLPWTGFTGNTLWDWLELILLPLVVATSSLWAEPGQRSIFAGHVPRPYLAAGGLALAVFVAVVAAGYLVPLSWTGFHGNTVWDWIKLLLLPVVVPAIILPLVSEHLRHRLVPADDPSADEKSVSG